jgi:enediyne biosynthesis protein E4
MQVQRLLKTGPIWALVSVVLGGFVVLPPSRGWASQFSALEFSEVATAAGVRATLRCGSPEKRWITEANGSGLAWLDYDNDGLMDLLIVNGSSMEELRRAMKAENAVANAPDSAQGVYLFHNLGHGRFEDVTERAGLRNPYWGTGANAADFNNDGYTDILITTLGRDLLYRNNGNGTFTEIGGPAGLSRTVAWHTGSAFGDFDGDGWLDIYVSGYVDLKLYSLAEPAPVCEYLGKKTFCGPIGLPGTRGILYHNNHDGTFSDATKSAGLSDLPPSHGFTVVADDFNQDGHVDLFVANDSDPNFLLLNRGDGTFREVALERGVAFNADGRAQSNMGVAVGDLTHTGRMDVLTTTFHHDYFPLFRQDANGYYVELAAQTGLAAATSQYLGWACGLTDFDNSGTRMFWSANGHVYPQLDAYFQPLTIFRMTAGKFSPVWEYPSKPQNSYRGAATADYDNDGGMDLAVLPVAGAPLLLHNDTAQRGAWVGLMLQGRKSNRDAIGAQVRVEACGASQYNSVRNGGSYLSRSDPRLHFGLGSCAAVSRIEVRWPGGARQELERVPMNQYSRIEEPQ